MAFQKTLSPKISARILLNVVQFIPAIIGHLLRKNFYTKCSRTNQLSNSIELFGAKVCNCLPLEIRKLPRTAFKQKIRGLHFEIFDAEDSYVDSPTPLNKIAK